MLLQSFIKLPIKPLYMNINIGLFFWELENLPKKWIKIRHWIDEIWVQSDFLFNIFKKMSLNVKKIPFQLDIKINQKLNREYFKLPEKKFIFLFVFDYKSFYYRKNPEGIVHAFKKAFRNREDVYLLIKTINANLFSKERDRLISLTEFSKNIKIINKFFSLTEHHSLLNLCDAYISLHRSEGLGLVMAEAMFLGKPVIATNYSGNLEFMNNKNSCLIKYKKVSVKKYEYIYSHNQKWAEPDINEASKYMKKIKEDKIYNKKISKRALMDMRLYSLRSQSKINF
jgi:glycosyltransferase involved in cell wall biosynthesis